MSNTFVIGHTQPRPDEAREQLFANFHPKALPCAKNK